MTQSQWSWRWLIVVLMCALGSALRGQTAASNGSTPEARITFDVVQSYDAKYAGDTPGHLGRAGGLDRVRLNVALQDAVYRGETKVGVVTGLSWNRTNSSIDIEFDPVGDVRVAVGDEVWMAADGRQAGGTAPKPAK